MNKQPQLILNKQPQLSLNKQPQLDLNEKQKLKSQGIVSNEDPELATLSSAAQQTEQSPLPEDPSSPQKTYDSNLSRYSQVEQTSIDYKTLDWYPYTGLEQRNGVCKGRYISPQIGSTGAQDAIPSLQEVFISADQTVTQLGKTSTLLGNVDIQQGNRSLHSPIAKLDQQSGAFSLEDGVTYRQTGLLISGSRAKGNINQQETSLFETKYVLHEQEARGEAGVIVRKTKDLIDIKQGSLTFCPPADNSWAIHAGEIRLDTKEGFGKAKKVKFTVLGTPVFYFPVFYFPLDDRRKSGFLFPRLKFSNSDSKLTMPYYFNIAPDIDDTLTTSIFRSRGILLENELRYLDNNSSNRLSTSFIKDSKFEEDRWALGVNHSGSYGQFKTVIDYTEVSDNDYFNDLDTDLNIDSGPDDHLNQSAKVSYQTDTWQSSVLLQKYQTTNNSTIKPYQRLPEIRISASPNENLENIDFSYRSVFTRFNRDQTGLTGADRVIGDRLIINPKIQGNMTNIWSYVKPSLKLWHANYNLQDQSAGVASSQSVTVPVVEVDSGLYFDKQFSFQGKGYTQTLEPRLYALHTPFVDQSDLPDFDTSELTFTYNSLFRDNRFSGDDRFGDSKQISLGLTSRVVSSKGREILSASVGRAFYFNNRKVRIKRNDAELEDDTSDLATSVIWRPNTRFRALFDAAFDANTLQNSEMTLDLKYQTDPNHVLGLRHRFTRETRSQSTLSHLWPISKVWAGLGLVQYDWLSNQTIDLAAGLEYKSCCWKTRLVLRNELQENNKRNSSIALQFVLKGLGGIGSSPTQALQDKIKGYDNREYYNANN